MVRRSSIYRPAPGRRGQAWSSACARRRCAAADRKNGNGRHHPDSVGAPTDARRRPDRRTRVYLLEIREAVHEGKFRERVSGSIARGRRQKIGARRQESRCGARGGIRRDRKGARCVVWLGWGPNGSALYAPRGARSAGASGNGKGREKNVERTFYART